MKHHEKKPLTQLSYYLSASWLALCDIIGQHRNSSLGTNSQRKLTVSEANPTCISQDYEGDIRFFFDITVDHPKYKYSR